MALGMGCTARSRISVSATSWFSARLTLIRKAIVFNRCVRSLVRMFDRYEIANRLFKSERLPFDTADELGRRLQPTTHGALLCARGDATQEALGWWADASFDQDLEVLRAIARNQRASWDTLKLLALEGEDDVATLSAIMNPSLREGAVDQMTNYFLLEVRAAVASRYQQSADTTTVDARQVYARGNCRNRTCPRMFVSRVKASLGSAPNRGRIKKIGCFVESARSTLSSAAVCHQPKKRLQSCFASAPVRNINRIAIH